MENKVVVLGSCSVCHVYQSPRMPEKGETVIGNESYVIVGGKGSGQAVVARRLGSEVFLLEHLMPIGADTSYTDISDDHIYLFHSEKSPFCCCTSGSLLDTILP